MGSHLILFLSICATLLVIGVLLAYLPIAGWSAIGLVVFLAVWNLAARRKRPYQNEVDPLHRQRPGMFDK